MRLEARTAAAPKHSNIRAVFKVGLHDGTPYCEGVAVVIMCGTSHGSVTETERLRS